MKKLLLLALSLAYVLVLFAGPVSEQQALQKARQFMQGKNLSMTQQTSQAGLDFDGVTPFYVFNAEKNGGFVVVSGDDRTKPILGYADEGSIDLTNLPENVKWWFNYYAQTIAALQDSGIEPIPAVQATRSTIKPLLTTTWSQGSPYNDQCVFDGYTCVTGCVATATAQVLNYYKYPAKVNAIDSYTTGSWSLNVPALSGATLNWKNMCNNYTGSETTAQKKAVATLMRYCGQSVEMDYTSSSSGAVTSYVALALVKYFKYNKSAHAIHRDGYDANGWESAIYNELAAKNPIIYCGRGSQVGGHCFVTDGYKDGLFHVNWGWGGSCDGYFVLTLMDAYGYGPQYPDYAFGADQHAIVGLKAKSGGSQSYPLLTICALEAQSTTATRSSSSDDFNVSVYWKLNPSVNEEDVSVTYSLGLYKGDKLVQEFLGYGLNLNPQYYWSYTNSLSFGSGLADGTYKLCAIYKDADGNVKKTQGFDYRYVEVVKKGNKLTLTNIPKYGGVKLNKTKATIAKGKTVTLKATLAPAELEDKSVTWKSSDKTVATVTSAGKVTGKKAGTATITCTSSTGEKATCKITVADVTLSETTLSLEKGKTATLKATVIPSSISDQSVTWESSNTKIATVTTAGKVKGVKAGTATITCTSKATGATATCKITITNGAVYLNKTEVALLKGKTVTLKPTVTPTSLKDKSVTWKSSDKSIATVTSAGKVKAVKEGVATITCTSKATGLSATCKVIVGKVVINVDEITLKKTREITLIATVYPTSLTDKSVTWKSSDKSIATVTSDGKVKGIKAGTVTITCTSKATGLKGTCKVTVLATAGSRSTEGDNDDTTGIKQLNENTVEPFDVYNLSGRKVLNKVTSMDGLPAGVYIVNGKKVLKK